MPGNFDFSVVISQVPRVQKIQGDIQKGPFNLQEGIQREVEKKARDGQQRDRRVLKGE